MLRNFRFRYTLRRPGSYVTLTPDTIQPPTFCGEFAQVSLKEFLR